MPHSVQNLIAFLLSHDIINAVPAGQSHIIVAGHVKLPNGEWIIERTRIAASLASCRAYLGY